MNAKALWALAFGAVLIPLTDEGVAAGETPQLVLEQVGYLDGHSGELWEQARDVAFDAAGNIVLVGGTGSADFPTTPGAYDRQFATGGTVVGSQGMADVFITKIDRDGRIVWSTLLGGPNYDRAYAVEIGADGSVYVAGRAGPGFPTTDGVVQPRFAGDNSGNTAYGHQDGFVVRLSADGSQLLWSTYLGGGGRGFVRDIDIDAAGRVYVGGANFETHVGHLITADAHQPRMGGRNDALYLRLSADGRRVEYGTYLGGSTDDHPASTGAMSVRVAADGSVALAMSDASRDMPVTPGAYQAENRGGQDLVVMRFSPGDEIIYATYLGGSGHEYVDTHYLAVDAAGRAYVSATSLSGDFPVTPGAVQTQAGGGADATLSILSPDGRRLVASTYLGGRGDETVEGIALRAKRDGPADLVVSGRTGSAGWPATSPAIRHGGGGNLDGFVAIYDLALSRIVAVQRVGGSRDDVANAAAVASDGRIAIVGETESDDMPVSPGAVDIHLDGRYGAWFAVFGPSPVAR